MLTKRATHPAENSMRVEAISRRPHFFPYPQAWLCEIDGKEIGCTRSPADVANKWRGKAVNDALQVRMIGPTQTYEGAPSDFLALL